ncbi:Fungal Zn(2)-Cys(6) binuclear cluster domain-containing protein [Penicillium ucsense]|uniref:Fungal Zn(2)-Cys(6) binuclear cluster domain-containing protein n=1 Tax=Penicillium ucsense TaxID=2839758 RepID=A0A8J8WK03_9EURO|nr:Fungal Zn(2)-Cys(6) binuclear cluster domain-containing protein [Penicillium ucsense]KAF7737233.1 Fungal Zn(2)-Cys(6) binuclear cluster domain-containing protein [Penicillium ucsense]
MDGARPSRPDRPYQRTYKACIPCRQRKAKCDLGTGPDGLPIGPPCARCRREMRECIFPEKRAWERSRKRGRSPDDNESEISPPERQYSSTIPVADHAGSQSSQAGPPPLQYDLHSTSPFQQSWTFAPPQQSPHDARSPQVGISPQSNADGSVNASSTSANAYGESRHRSGSILANSMMRTVVASGNDALNILFEAATASQEDNAPNGESPAYGVESRGGGPNGHFHTTPKNFESPAAFEPILRARRSVELSEVTPEILRVWEACRFVKMGWFTAREAVTFLDLFYKNMSCLSPILTDFYANHQNHLTLITREPVLCSTILMISSRYHILPGASGESRNFYIHHRLWQYCQQLITRLIFGQEKSTKSKIRSLGTVEALLLMAEWHPRSLHFPPEADGWDDELFSMDLVNPDHAERSESSESRWIGDMTEPSRRSDQMSWMLLGCAHSLAHELGLFDTEESDPCTDDHQWKEQIRLRRQRDQRLLYVYMNQLAWRIGRTSPSPQSLNHAVLGGRKPRGLSQPGSTWLVFMDSWIELTKLAQSVTDMFFPSAKFARQQLHSGRYVGLLEHFRPLLNQWKDKYLQPSNLDTAFYNDLFIEYHFVRVYTHSVGMQAVVERAVAHADLNNLDDVRPMTIDPTDYEYIQEVIDGCCQILQRVTNLADVGALRFSPVRIVLRVTSASIFLMKALSLGTREKTLRESLEVLERSISALKSNALDDVHLSTRYATLLEMHVSRLRRNLLASSKILRHNDSTTHNSRGATRRSSMGPPSWPENGDRPSAVNAPAPQDMTSDMGFVPSLGDMADDWLSLPFDPSMAPFGMSSNAQFPMYESGGLDFIWNLPS